MKATTILRVFTSAGCAAAILTSCDAMMEPSMSMGVNVGSGGLIPFSNVGAIFTPAPTPPPVVAGPSHWGVSFVPPQAPGNQGWNTPRPPASSIVPSQPIRPSGEPGPVIMPSRPSGNAPEVSPTRPGGRLPAGSSDQSSIGPGMGSGPGMLINGQNRPLSSGGGRY